LTLDGVACGFLNAVAGGDVSADVIEEAVAPPDFFARKHIGQPKYEDFVLQMGLSMAQVVYDWIAASLKGSFARKDGSVTAFDVNSNAKDEQQFSQALITEVGFPALDGGSKDAAHLTVKFSPEFTRTAKASGKVPGGAVGTKQKSLIRANFRFELDGLDASHVRSIDAFAVRVLTSIDDIGDARDRQREPTSIEFPNLRVTMTDGQTATTWQSWFDDFVIKGKNSGSNEKSGAIVYLAPDLKTELGRVVLHNVGIFALRRSPKTSADTVSTVTAELFCERMELVVGKPAPAKAVVDKPVLDQPVQPIALPVKPLGIRR
jgi:hypothetical protein